MSAPPRGSLLGQAWLILAISTLFGGALAGVHLTLAPRIEANTRAAIVAQLPALVLPPAELEGATIAVAGERIELAKGGATVALLVAERQVAGRAVYEVRREGGEPAGYVVRGKGPGYADDIELLVGLSPDLVRLTGIFVVSQKETPALGDGIVKESFRRWFAGVPSERPLSLTKSAAEAERQPGKVLALTAATISSRSVCDIVNRTVAEVRPALAAPASAPQGGLDGGR